MTPNETTQLKTMAEVNRRLRRQIDQLKEALSQETESRRQFDAESEQAFQLVRKNHSGSKLL